MLMLHSKGKITVMGRASFFKGISKENKIPVVVYWNKIIFSAIFEHTTLTFPARSRFFFFKKEILFSLF